MYGDKFWNERYKSKEFFYGVEPNSFLVEHSHLLKGKILSLSEGEGRNAVFLASKGFDVHGVDLSEVALDKAQILAKSKNVEIQTEVTDLAEYKPKENFYDSVISISAHLPSVVRNRLYPLVEKCLKPDGIIIFEAYSENQFGLNSGGPKDIDMLMTVNKLKCEFSSLEPLIAREIEREVNEGEGHKGLSSVVQFVARKNA